MTHQIQPVDPLELVRQRTADKGATEREAADADARWRAAIKAAVAVGERVTEIAAAAGISRDRVYQIRDGRR
jgi:hypothetical protein